MRSVDRLCDVTTSIIELIVFYLIMELEIILFFHNFSSQMLSSFPAIVAHFVSGIPVLPYFRL